MKNKVIVLITILFFILIGIFTKNLNYNPLFSFVLYVSYFIFEVYLIRKQYNYRLPLFILFSLFSLVLIIKLVQNKWIVIPTDLFVVYLIFLMLFLLAKLFTNTSKGIRIISVISMLAFSFFISFILFNVLDNKHAFNTYTGFYNKPWQNIVVTDKNLNQLYFEQDKIYVIDVWNNTCGVCIMKFPLFEKLKKKYKTNKNVIFIGLNVYKEKNEVVTAQTITKDYNFTGDNYFLKTQDLSKVAVSFYPTVLVVKKDTIIFRGSIETLNIFHNRYLGN